MLCLFGVSVPSQRLQEDRRNIVVHSSPGQRQCVSPEVDKHEVVVITIFDVLA